MGSADFDPFGRRMVGRSNEDPFENMREQMEKERDAFFHGSPHRSGWDGDSPSSRGGGLFGRVSCCCPSHPCCRCCWPSHPCCRCCCPSHPCCRCFCPSRPCCCGRCRRIVWSRRFFGWHDKTDGVLE